MGSTMHDKLLELAKELDSIEVFCEKLSKQ